MNILVSACLLGIKCRYDANVKVNEDVMELSKRYTLIPVCPEQLGGLPTPREPAEIRDGRVITKDAKDVTERFTLGATQAVRLAKICNCGYAVLKSKSPSCSNGLIYDGSFSSKLVNGYGVTAKALEKEGVVVLNENELNKIE